jgi:hypothetical protein
MRRLLRRCGNEKVTGDDGVGVCVCVCVNVLKLFAKNCLRLVIRFLQQCTRNWPDAQGFHWH